MANKLEKYLLLDVKYNHSYKSWDGKFQKMYVMHPKQNKQGDGAGMFAILKDRETGNSQYVTSTELAELFAVNGFVELGLNLRMQPEEKYEGGAPPALKPSMSDVAPGSSFELAVNEKRSEILQHGLSNSLHSKLIKIGVGLPDKLLPRDPIGSTSIMAMTHPPSDPLRDEQPDDRLDEDIESASKLEYPIEDIQQRAIKTRRGQPDFRKRIFAAYGDKCAITGCEVQSVLEAAHIVPHADETNYDTSNGLPLRADIHTLFDLRLLAVSEDYRIKIHTILAGSEYEKFHGKTIGLPKNKCDYPALENLAKHFEGFVERCTKEE